MPDPVIEKITVIEQDGLRAAWGLWNSPRDALEGPMKTAWRRVSSAWSGFPGDLQPGEWDTVDVSQVSADARDILKKAYDDTVGSLPGAWKGG